MKHNLIFQEKLVNRIRQLRPLYALKDKQLRGKLFNSDSWAYEGTVGAVLAAQHNVPNLLILDEARGLSLDPMEIEMGRYDPIITVILSHLATIDFSLENSVALH